MPPKKKNSADAPAAPARSSRSTARAAPPTYTAHGVEHESTAAATRPTRKINAPHTFVPETAPLRAATPKIAPSTVKHIGYAGAAIANPAFKTRGGGRQPKSAAAPAPAAAATTSKKRGRPAKETVADAEQPPKKRGGAAKPATTATSTTAALKKRGRPAAAGKRGRPAKSQAIADAVPPEEAQALPKKRGRPPRGGETTKIDGDDGDAAEQLGEELMDAVDGEDADEEKQDKTRQTKKGPAQKNGKAKKNDATEGQKVETDTESGKQYWLMKAEGHDRFETLPNGGSFNTKFTIDDLREKNGPEAWDGVRNPSAAKNLRAMKQGDLAFFYASNGKTPGIVGIMEIVKEHEPDQTAWDENNPYYVPEDKNRKKWCMVHVEFRKKLSKPVSRDELKEHVGDGGALSGMQEFTAARLSVSKVTEDEWNFIHRLIKDDDEEEVDGALPAADEADAGAEETDVNSDKATVETSVKEYATTIVTEKSNGDISVEQQEEMEIDLPAFQNGFAPATAMTTTELEITTTDTLFPAPTSAAGPPSSRPTSRGTGAKGSSRLGSRAGSLAPSGKAGRARSRSRTPFARDSSVQPMTTVIDGVPVVEEYYAGAWHLVSD